MRVVGLGAALAVVGLGAGLGSVAEAEAQERERCYGVVEAGEDDGVDGDEDPGSSTVDYQGNAWVWVEVDTCLTIRPPQQPDGTPRRGSYEPLARDLPDE